MVVCAAEKKKKYRASDIDGDDGEKCLPWSEPWKEELWRVVYTDYSCWAVQRKWGGECQVGKEPTLARAHLLAVGFL